MKTIKRVVRAMPMILVLGCLIIAQLSASPLKRPVPLLPSDHTQAYNGTPEVSPAIPKSSRDASAGASELPQDNPFQNLSATLQRLRDEYARIVAKFNALRFDCKSNMRLRVDDAVADAVKWKHTVDVLGLIEEISDRDLNNTEKELIIRNRLASQGLTGAALEARVRAFNQNDLGHITDSEQQLVLVSRLRQRGLTEQQIAEVLRGSDPITKELRPMYENLDRLTWENLRNAYNKAYQCCLCSAQDFFPSMMSNLFREMTVLSETEAVKVGSIEKNEECLRAVQQKLKGAGWKGTITFESNYQYRGSGEKANNISYWQGKSSYSATIQLDGKVDEHGAPIATLAATANETTVRGGRGTVACYRISEQRQEVSGAAQDDKALGRVNLDQRTGAYTVDYTLKEVKATGSYRVTSKVGGTCNNPFNKSMDQTQEVKDYPIETGPYVQIEGKVDPENPDSLFGSKTMSVRGREGGERQIRVTWNLTYCRKG